MENLCNINRLLKEKKQVMLKARKLNFVGVESKDVYNITAPFLLSDKEYIAGRVESRENERSKVIFFFKNIDGNYERDRSAPIFNLQDPFIFIIDKEIIFGGVEAKQSKYKTIFYRGENIFNLKKFAEGPIGMKDIRFIQLPDNKIGVFTRPQGKIGGRGRIGFMIVESLDHLSRLKEEDYFSAKILNESFCDDEWIGSNSACLLKNGAIGVLGHIAGYSGNSKKNYYPITFTLDLNGKVSNVKIILTRDELPEGDAKNEDLKNVLFSGGMIRMEDGTAKIYTGAGDAESYEVVIKDPFYELENDQALPRDSLANKYDSVDSAPSLVLTESALSPS